MSNSGEDTVDNATFFDAFTTLDKEDYIRGQTIAGVEQRCLKLCQSYLGGSWAQAKSPADIEVKRIAGGFTNQMYSVKLSDSVVRVENVLYPKEPNAVAIKFYQSKHLVNYGEDETERLNDTVVLTILSQTAIGPTVYGIFNDGFIQEYFECENFSLKHQQSPDLLKQLVQRLAAMNHLNVPLRKDNNWMFEHFQKTLDEAFNPANNTSALIDELNLEQLKRHDLRVEFLHFKRYITELNAPVVFCHNDFRGVNILVTKDEQIKLVDPEYSSYGYRGHDLGTFFLEWEKETFEKGFKVPTDEAVTQFITWYIEECDRLKPGYASKPENSVKTIIAESKTLMLAQFMFFMTFFLKQKESFVEAIPFDKKANLRQVEYVYQSYLKIKETLIKEGIIKNP